MDLSCTKTSLGLSGETYQLRKAKSPCRVNDSLLKVTRKSLYVLWILHIFYKIVTVDVWTSYAARIMGILVVLFVIV